jgi:Asp-tRNA(Asn)/Glu-tRNA(Gln) amidotransferase A subunit family amidase
MAFPPRLSGRTLHAVARLSGTHAGAALLYRVARRDLRIGQLAKLASSFFGDVPIDTAPIAGRPPRDAVNAGLALPAAPWSGTSATLSAAYGERKVTPLEIVDRAIAAARALGSRTPSVGPVMDFCEDVARREAEASAERWRKGAPLGPLDGVPYAVKEETAVRGLPARGGTDLIDGTPAARDATCVARLRSAGAIVIGQTPMTEFGMTPLGFNPKRLMPRNPHATGHVAGGSSTGSAVAVATGVVPFAVGADGGGSIRIPSALCGVFGIKPTWGRVSRHGDLFGGTVGHLGPIASSTLDLARFLEVVSGLDPDDPQTRLAPPLVAGSLVGALSRGVRGMRIGVEASEWADASPEIAKAGREALRVLEKEGAELIDVRVELARWAASIGYLAIGLESLASQRDLLQSGAVFNEDLAITYAGLGPASANDYVHAQRLRTGLRQEVAGVLRDVDILALPTTATTATRVTDAEFNGGFLDARALDALCRFNFLGNLTGLPALSAPVGLGAQSLPIGLQFVGDAWDEATVLAAAAHLEHLGVARAERPAVAVDALRI